MCASSAARGQHDKPLKILCIYINARVSDEQLHNSKLTCSMSFVPSAATVDRPVRQPNHRRYAWSVYAVGNMTRLLGDE